MIDDPVGAYRSPFIAGLHSIGRVLQTDISHTFWGLTHARFSLPQVSGAQLSTGGLYL